jgi:hexosaminidase
MTKYLLLLFSIFVLGCTAEKSIEVSDIALIPKPQQIEMGHGAFSITSETSIYAPIDFKLATDFLKQYVMKGAGLELTEASEKTATIVFQKKDSIPREGYELDVSVEKIIVSASDTSGAFYAVQTLRQLLPANLDRKNSLPKKSIELPVLKITDAPQFSYRGMHLDVARHFFPKEFIKEYISYLAMMKMNTFHWHLTDDQGWRIEIKKYPKLTTKAAYRNETLIGHYNDTPQQYDGKRYGGFYTQEDIKEIVAFAFEHNITIIPEIEMPGHAQAAISAYPELGCTGQTIDVATKWGVFENIFCPNQKTFAFLKDVLSETMDLFPSEYIHIGGDEAPKTQWKKCAHCQKLITQHNLKDENGLQSWFIKEIETFVNNKGKKIIGWDEILEGGLAPNATVMSWRGTAGAVEAANEGHDVIMTPTSHAYFDYYQDDNPEEPVAIGGYLPLKKVYGFNPIPEGLLGKASEHILGAQGNIWTEYIPTTDQVEYMLFPRALAMAEVNWSGATKDMETDYSNFLSRVEPFMERLDMLDVNYANHLYDLEGTIVKKNDSVYFELKTPTLGKEIKYSINASEEKIYKNPIPISQNTQLTAQVYKEGQRVGRPFSESIHFHKGVTASVSLNVEPHPAYNTGGKEALINGVSGSDTRYGDKEWLGFWGDDLEITITFPEPTKVSTITTRFYNANGQWIYAPVAVGLYAMDMENSIGISAAEDETLREVTLRLIDPEEITSLILKIENFGVIPEGLQGAGNKAWTFIDEIVVE